MRLPWSAASRCRASSAICSGRPPCSSRSWCCSPSFTSRRFGSGAPACAFPCSFPGDFLGGSRRQHCDGLDLEKRALAREGGDPDGGARRPVLIGEIAVAHLAEYRQMLGIHEIIVEFHHVRKFPADRAERGFEV